MVPEDLVFWMAPIDGEPDATEGVLCQRHADRLTVPAGWVVDDRRDPTLRLFRPRRSDGEDIDGRSNSSGATQRQRSRRPTSPPGSEQVSLPFAEDHELDANASRDDGHDDGMASEPARMGNDSQSRDGAESHADEEQAGMSAPTHRSRRQPGSLLRRAWGMEED